MERRAITIRGTVQGVGFRPFVFGQASALGLGGFVRNTAGDVCIEAEGDPEHLDQFEHRLRELAPPLARIDTLASGPRPVRGEQDFRIEVSEDAAEGGVSFNHDGATSGGGGGRLICPDVGTCDACLAEAMDPADRRHRYPFTNCTHCGPRLTIIQGTPYDRARTTMARFPMCDACRAEYEDPTDRRFHAQPVACPVCGPRLIAVLPDGRRLEKEDALAALVEVIRAGGIGAVKGLGGYHLVCDARDPAAVAELRRRKQREEKPFAVMLADLASARACCEVNEKEAALLASSRRPIVLLRQRGGGEIADGVAPGNPWLGVMLPYTPLHYLLVHDLGVEGPTSKVESPDAAEASGSVGSRLSTCDIRPSTPDPRSPVLVMTSGNRAHEPIVFRDDEAVDRLGGIAEVILTHDRPIHARCDDSVTRVVAGAEMPIRRSRGDAPQPIRLSTPVSDAGPILAVGGQLKNTFALAAGRAVFLSQHMGDLDDLAAYRAFERDIVRYQDLLAITPGTIVHDLHPGYASTRYAQQRAQREGLGLLAVQHHHAHMAGVIAEHGLDGPVIGVSFDGTGYGTDGTVWGGEFLVGDCRGFTRAAYLRRVAMPGGEQAVREPWRMAASHLADARVCCETLEQRLDPAAMKTVRRMLERQVNSPWTSSAGRLFDAVASIAGVRDRVSYQGQAAIELEHLADHCPLPEAEPEPYPFDVVESFAEAEALEKTPGNAWEVDTRPIIRAAANDIDHGVAPPRIARRFHDALTRVIVTVCERLSRATGVTRVALSGGVFLSARLTAVVEAELRKKNFKVFRNHLVSPGDGGLCLGQAAIAAVCSQQAPPATPGSIPGPAPEARHTGSLPEGGMHVPGHPRQGHRHL